MNYKQWLFCLLIMLCILLLTACSQGEKVIASTDTVYIVQNGRQTCITDRETGKTYELCTRRVKRGEGPDRPVTVEDTGSFRLVLVEGGYIVEAGGEVYESLSKWGGLILWENR